MNPSFIPESYRILNQSRKPVVMGVSVINGCLSPDEMDMPPVAHVDGRSGEILYFVEMVIEKVRIGKYPMLVTSAMDWNCLAGHSCKPVVVQGTVILKSRASYKFVNMFLPSRC